MLIAAWVVAYFVVAACVVVVFARLVSTAWASDNYAEVAAVIALAWPLGIPLTLLIWLYFVAVGVFNRS